jgi:hypothetical protein
MPPTLPSLRDLLAAGGFRLRTGTRADCAHCRGNSRGTVSYNAEVAHCFRCGWSANRFQLAREAARAAQVAQAEPVAQALQVAQALLPVRVSRLPGERWLIDSLQTRTGKSACATRARREFRRRGRDAAAIRAFTCWREAALRRLSDRYWALSRAALRAGKALAGSGPASGALTPGEQELAWDALARFHHAEAELSAAFDFLMCAKASAWLEDDARIEQLFAWWKEKQHRHSK